MNCFIVKCHALSGERSQIQVIFAVKLFFVAKCWFTLFRYHDWSSPRFTMILSHFGLLRAASHNFPSTNPCVYCEMTPTALWSGEISRGILIPITTKVLRIQRYPARNVTVRRFVLAMNASAINQ